MVYDKTLAVMFHGTSQVARANGFYKVYYCVFLIRATQSVMPGNDHNHNLVGQFSCTKLSQLLLRVVKKIILPREESRHW